MFCDKNITPPKTIYSILSEAFNVNIRKNVKYYYLTLYASFEGGNEKDINILLAVTILFSAAVFRARNVVVKQVKLTGFQLQAPVILLGDGMWVSNGRDKITLSLFKLCRRNIFAINCHWR